MQDVLDLIVRLPNPAPDFPELRTRFIRHKILRDNGTGDLFLEQPIREQSAENLIERGLRRMVSTDIVGKRPGGTKNGGTVEQLPHGEHRVLFRTLNGCTDVAHISE